MQDSSSTITAALRQAADLLDQHPELPRPYITTSVAGRVKAAWYLTIDHHDRGTQKAVAAQIVRAIGGTWDKREQDDDFYFDSTLGLLDLTVNVDRPAVCERVVVGTEQVTIPAQPATEAQPERVEEREIVEWRCESLLRPDEKSAVAS